MPDPLNKVAIPTSKYDYKVIKAAFKIPPKVLKEEQTFNMYSVCIFSRKPFFGQSNIKITNALITGGIIKYWFNYLLDFEVKALEEPPKEPKVFAIADLEFGFIVWLVACGISLTVFLIEFSYVYAKRNIKKFIRELSGLYAFIRFIGSGRLHL